MSQWIQAARIEEIPEEGKHVLVGEEEVLLVRDGDRVYAVSYLCTHQDMELEGGHREGGAWVCPHHGAKFDLRTGEALSMPAVEPVRVFEVRVEEGWVHVRAEEAP
jgi:3-phenylpropionate/trans-cinnamate dioxygenase ferredoxin subunit